MHLMVICEHWEHCIYFIDQLDSIVPFQRLDCHSSGIHELGQVYGLACVDTSQIDQVLEPLQRQRLVLRPATENRNRKLFAV